MAGSKFYAVRVGLKPGVYRTWEECFPLIHGVKGAVYKSFPTREAAEAFVQGGDGPSEAVSAEAAPSEGRRKKNFPPEEEAPYPVPEGTLVAFVDGSYDAVTKKYGFGCVLLTDDGREICENGWGEHPEAVTARNVAGELQGTLTALRRAEEMGYHEVRICHDYTGIAAWYRGEWRANTYVSRQYVAAAEAYRGILNVTFEKIAAHTGVKYNEMADRLAKQAIGIED